MIFKELYIELNRLENSTEESYEFLTKSRCLCNFIERECLKRNKFKNDFYRRIVIILSKNPSKECWVNSERVLCVEIDYIKGEFDKINELHLISEYYIEKLIQGLNKAKKNNFDIPDEEILASIEIFRKEKYVNKWVHKKKTIRSHSLVVSLCCELNINNFLLDLFIYSKNDILYHKRLLKLDADEIAFDYRFKDIIVNGNQLIITSKIEEDLFEMNLRELLVN